MSCLVSPLYTTGSITSDEQSRYFLIWLHLSRPTMSIIIQMRKSDLLMNTWFLHSLPIIATIWSDEFVIVWWWHYHDESVRYFSFFIHIACGYCHDSSTIAIWCFGIGRSSCYSDIVSINFNLMKLWYRVLLWSKISSTRPSVSSDHQQFRCISTRLWCISTIIIITIFLNSTSQKISCIVLQSGVCMIETSYRDTMIIYDTTASIPKLSVNPSMDGKNETFVIPLSHHSPRLSRQILPFLRMLFFWGVWWDLVSS